MEARVTCGRTHRLPISQSSGGRSSGCSLARSLGQMAGLSGRPAVCCSGRHCEQLSGKEEEEEEEEERKAYLKAAEPWQPGVKLIIEPPG